MPGGSEPVHVTRQEEGLLQGLGEVRCLPSLGLPKSCIPQDGGIVQLQAGRPGALLPPNDSLLLTIDGLRPLVLGLFAFLLLFGLLEADLTLL